MLWLQFLLGFTGLEISGMTQRAGRNCQRTVIFTVTFCSPAVIGVSGALPATRDCIIATSLHRTRHSAVIRDHFERTSQRTPSRLRHHLSVGSRLHDGLLQGRTSCIIELTAVEPKSIYDVRASSQRGVNEQSNLLDPSGYRLGRYSVRCSPPPFAVHGRNGHLCSRNTQRS